MGAPYLAPQRDFRAAAMLGGKYRIWTILREPERDSYCEQ
jgi:hypothetical protein